MNQYMWYVTKPQGIDTALVYCHPNNTGKITLYKYLSEAEKVAKEIGPDWRVELLMFEV